MASNNVMIVHPGSLAAQHGLVGEPHACPASGPLLLTWPTISSSTMGTRRRRGMPNVPLPSCSRLHTTSKVLRPLATRVSLISQPAACGSSGVEGQMGVRGSMGSSALEHTWKAWAVQQQQHGKPCDAATYPHPPPKHTPAIQPYTALAWPMMLRE